MATTTNTNGGTTTSFSNTPQARDDTLTTAAGGSLITEDSILLILDVMANDLGGNAKVLWSLDDGTSASTATKIYAPADLLTQDTARVESMSTDYSAKGAHIWITSDGKIGYDTATFSASVKASLQALALGETLTDSFTYAIRLGNGTLSWATATVAFSGANDGITITSAAQTGTVTEDAPATPSTTDSLSASGTVAFNDVDLTDTHTASFAAAAGNTTSLGTFELAAVNEAASAANGSVQWTYNLNNTAAQYLAQGQSVTETYVVTISDGHGSTATQNVTITITGTNDVVTITSAAQAGTVTEDAPTTPSTTDSLSASGTVAFNDVDLTDTHTASFAAAAGNSTSLGTFALAAVIEAANAANGSVQWTYNLNNTAAQYLAQGQSVTETYAVTISDGHGSTATQDVTITITGTNDQPTLTIADDLGAMNEGDGAATLSDSGALSFADLDTNDVVTVSQSSKGDIAWSGGTLNPTLAAALVAGFAVDQNSWDYSTSENLDFLREGETITFSYDVVATDDSGAGNAASAAHTVTITITGTNDQPTLTIADDLGAMNEGDGAATLSDSGALSFADLDTNDVVTVSQSSNGDIAWSGGTLNPTLAAALVAGFAVDQNSWDYSTSENLDFLREGETITFSYDVVATDDSGAGNAASAAHTVTITITGTNDQPTLTIADDLGAMNEGDGAATLSDSGALSFADLDTNDVVTVSQSSNGDIAWSGGTLNPTLAAALVAGFAVDQNSWDYSTSENLDFLREGETITFSYDVVATDDSGAGNAASAAHTVTITITGTNDQPTLTIADDLGAMNEGDGAATLSDSGALSFADLDTNDVVTVSQSSNGDIAWSGGTLNPTLAAALVAGFAVDQNSWDYSTSENLDFLREGETITFSYDVVATDDSGAGNAASAAHTVTITITGTNDQPTLTIADDLGAMNEGDGAATLSDSGALSFADLDTNDVVTVSQSSNGDIAWSGGTLNPTLAAALVAGFAVDQNSWDYSTSENLDFLREGETITFSYDVVATDDSGAGNAASAAHTVTITITGTNDQPTLTIADDLGAMNEGDGAATLSDSGALSFADLDTNDVVTVSQSSNGDIAWSGGTLNPTLAAALVAGFAVDQNSWDYSTSENLDFLREGETITFSYDVVATDDSGAGNAASAAHTVTITITGTNDQPTLTIADDLGAMNEGDGAATLSDSGALSFADLDTNDVVTVSQSSNGDIAWSGGTLNPTLAAALVAGFAVDQNSWDYSTSENLDFLREGETITFSYDVVATDDSGAGNAASAAHTVTITITGTNDQPTLTIADDLGAMNEGDGAATLSDSGALSFADLDTNDVVTVSQSSKGDIAWSGGTLNPTLAAALVAGFAVDQNSWDYSTSENLDFLREGETITFSYDVVATDDSGAGNAASAAHTVTITITGTNDQPTLTIADDLGAMNEGDGAATLSDSGALSFADLDTNDVVTVSQSSNGDIAWSGGTLNPTLAAALVAGFAVDQNSWDYSTSENLDFLREGETITFSYDVVATDDSGAGNAASAAHTVTITITGTNDQPTLTIADDLGAMNEGDGAATLSDSGALSFADLDTNDVVTVSQSSKGDIAWSGGTLNPTLAAALVAGFAVDQNSWDYSTSENLDFLREGETITFSYDVVATDDSGAGNAASAAHTVTITITGTNDQPTLTIADDLGAMNEGDGAATLSDSGALSFADLDTNDVVTVSQSSKGDIAWSGGTLNPTLAAALVAGFAVDQNSWDYSTSENLDFLREGETITFSYDVVATDDSGAGNAASAAHTVTITITGTNDQPTLTIADDLGAMNEGDGAATLSDSGALSFADLDTNDVVTVSQSSNGDIAWSGGTLNPTLAAALVAGFAVDQNSWDYSTSENLDFLREGETITFSYDVVATDDSGAGNAASAAHTVTITITGTNDQPTLTIADDLGAMNEGDGAATLSDSGALSFADLDTNDVVTVSQSSNGDIAWSGGTLNPTLAAALVAGFAVDQNSWDYSTSENLDFLREGETITFSYDVVATDDSGAGNAASAAHTVTITITGTNDTPNLATPAALSYTDTAADDTFANLTGVLGATDADAGDSKSFSIVGGSNGSFPVGLNTYQWMQSSSYGTLYVNSGTGAYEFVPTDAAIEALKVNANISFSVRVTDGENAFDTELLALNLVGVNDTPSSTNDSVSTNEDTAKILALSDFGIYADRDNDAIAAVKITTLESNGSLEYDTTGTGTWAAVTLNQEISAAAITAGQLRFVPDANESGTPYATIGFKVGDGSAFSDNAYTLTVNVNALNDNPVAVADTLWVSSSTTVTLSLSTLLGNDYDVDGLAVSITGFSAAAGQFTTNPTLNGNGTFSFTTNATGGTTLAPTVRTFTYTITDGAGGTHSGTVTVNVVLVGGGADTVNLGGVGNYDGSYIDGGAQGDTLTGGAPGDAFIGGNQNDNLTGSAGDDILRGGANNDMIDGGAGIDLLDWSDASGGVSYTLVQSSSDTSINIGAGLNTDTYKNMEGIIGSNAVGTGDSLTGSSSADVLWGMAGNDTLNGAAGNDTLRGGVGNDTIDGGAGTGDLIDFSDAIAAINFTLVQSASNTTVGVGVTPGLGQDIYRNIEGVIGSSYNDTLIGSTSNDIFVGGSGADTMTGGSGSDTFKFLNSDASAVDSITDFQVGSGDDVLDFSNLLAGAGATLGTLSTFVSLRESGGDTIVTVDQDAGGALPAQDVVTLMGVTNLSLADLTTNNQILF